ncbi:unnamed protein product [Urochloa decumbens]|uniref:Uncharacterized protein n=1 Tax=Urochloa decumbens TaxID=240449 RepID=A0ABC9CIP0_9POAL
MAPRGSEEAPRARAILAVAALLLVVPMLLSSLPLTDAAGGSSPSPAPAPAPAPLRHPPPATPQHAAPGGSSKPRTPPVPGHPGARRHPPGAFGAAHPTETSGWWRRLNFGERVGIALAGVAVAMQVALGAFLCARARQLRRRRRAAAAGKAEEREAAAASSSTRA